MFDKSRIPTFYELTEQEQNEVRERFKRLKGKQKRRALVSGLEDEYSVELLSKSLFIKRAGKKKEGKA
ncbi:hypothetical protein SAMN02745150_01171 [Brevinema andersonii]|uniref:Uncharacterized protein n=1 Tax=Brevinema andersonii TaxID=34097 RepID=A0A1I1ENG6_BREAD|nr:hypothetical protein [Brevinema andersonii]SFB88206.1 hypothetical protein SAMN02745150_01171 [Brevinema andersonii]